MAPLAVTLGLTAELRASRPRLPVRRLTIDVMIENNALTAKATYHKMEIALGPRPQL